MSAPVAVGADQIRIAVASNFTKTLTVLADRFIAESRHDVRISSGSTGKHYAQIINGAPFDVFFAADKQHPKRLVQEGLGLPGSRFTYAVGRLVLWSPRREYIDSDGKVLARGDFRYLAIANPELAPYGIAAREVLQSLDLWKALEGRLVRGENIGQTYQFVSSGNADLGFVAGSQLYSGMASDGSRWDVPQVLYTAIEQQALLLRDNDAANAFLSFVRSEWAAGIIRDHGYDLPVIE